MSPMPSPLPARREDDLCPADRERLESAHRRLQEAVDAYTPFLGRELRPGEDVPVHRLEDVARAQAAIETAEAELWRLREELLGWAPTPGAPKASQMAEWFSEEDRIYDDVDDVPGR
jgi:hypothetical protein